MWQWIAWIHPMRFSGIGPPVSVWCIGLPIPVIPLEMLMICSSSIFRPALIFFLVFISPSIENILHTSYTLLCRAKTNYYDTTIKCYLSRKIPRGPQQQNQLVSRNYILLQLSKHSFKKKRYKIQTFSLLITNLRKTRNSRWDSQK